MPKKKNYNDCLTTPFKTGIKNFTSVANYFLYYAPNIDSAQSVGKIENPKADILFNEMLKKTNLEEKCRVLKKIQPGSWKTLNFDEEFIDFEDSRMLFDKYNYETYLRALTRHLRNALAHGYIYVWKKKKGNFIFLIDFDSSKNKCTAKILVSMTILESWKALIEAEIAIGE